MGRVLRGTYRADVDFDDFPRRGARGGRAARGGAARAGSCGRLRVNTRDEGQGSRQKRRCQHDCGDVVAMPPLLLLAGGLAAIRTGAPVALGERVGEGGPRQPKGGQLGNSSSIMAISGRCSADSRK
jgi:hypothetical protein